MIPIVLPEGLKKEVKKNLKSKAYTQKEVDILYQQILSDNQTARKGWKVASYTVIGIMTMFFIISFSKIMESSIILYTLIIISIIMIFILLFIKFIYVDRIKRQFLKYVKLGGYILDK